MISYEQNEALTRVGAGTDMGDVFRLFWIPFYPGEQLIADGQPKRIKLLGEDLVVFRDTDGRVGLIENACPHRGAPLMYGRNEECGLRCVYHGWKFDVEGNIVDTPTEPEKSRISERVTANAYPCVERNNIVWAYMGPDREVLPPLPELEWNLVPAENVVVSFRVQECNWLQALEGEIDSAHAPILHSRIDERGAINDWIAAQDLRPKFKIQQQSFGLSIASKRDVGEGCFYWRVNQFMLPFWTLVPPQSKYPELSGHAWVPIDDEHTLCLMFSYTPKEPFYPHSKTLLQEGYKGRETGHASRNCYAPRSSSTPYADFWTKFTPENAYQIDYSSQQSKYFSGLPGLWIQDAACQSGVMAIYDRTKENLCASDAGIVSARRLLLETIENFKTKKTRPAGTDRPETYMVRAVSITLPKEQPWLEACTNHMRAVLGKDFEYEP
jgi:phenylpropionate dioxygenase-like ring-hydroxylating dioxygenase large terminal subunit